MGCSRGVEEARCLRRVKHLLDVQVCRLGLEKKKGRAVFLGWRIVRRGGVI
ncbi:hypothetical protein [Bartonella massiliensis]|uniref:hypothetical protein n=1 Tax=Bartonella massiliensis TaxID=929795 RepID=UPI00163BD0A6|nr:hypothetical protein [Bartonella massiliensis]